MVSFLNQSSAKGPTDPPKKQSSNNLPKTKDPDFCHQTESWIFLRLFLKAYQAKLTLVTSPLLMCKIFPSLAKRRHPWSSISWTIPELQGHLLAGQIRQAARRRLRALPHQVTWWPQRSNLRSAGSSWLLARNFLATSRARSLVFWSVARCRRLISVWV